MSDSAALECSEELDRLRNLPKEQVQAEYDICIPRELQLLASFWECYTADQITIGLRACLLLWAVTSGNFVPREFQLQATIALMSEQDCLVDVGTGYGKTLCMILPCLLAPHNISMVVSPLKQLQSVQVDEFERYGIKTVAINEDTPSDTELWQVSFDVPSSELLTSLCIRISLKGLTRLFWFKPSSYLCIKAI
jgi:hypothetical protein